MKVINDKVDNSNQSDGYISAADFNSVKNELSNAIGVSIPLDENSNVQLSHSIDIASKANLYKDVSIVDNFVKLDRHYSPQGKAKVFDDMTFDFICKRTNTGPTQLQIGKNADDIILKKLLNKGNELKGGELKVDKIYKVYYDSAADAFQLLLEEHYITKSKKNVYEYLEAFELNTTYQVTGHSLQASYSILATNDLYLRQNKVWKGYTGFIKLPSDIKTKFIDPALQSNPKWASMTIAFNGKYYIREKDFDTRNDIYAPGKVIFTSGFKISALNMYKVVFDDYVDKRGVTIPTMTISNIDQDEYTAYTENNKLQTVTHNMHFTTDSTNAGTNTPQNGNVLYPDRGKTSYIFKCINNNFYIMNIYDHLPANVTTGRFYIPGNILKNCTILSIYMNDISDKGFSTVHNNKLQYIAISRNIMRVDYALTSNYNDNRFFCFTIIGVK